MPKNKPSGERPASDQIRKELSRIETRSRFGSVMRNTLAVILSVAAVAVLIATFLLPVMRIYGNAMKPNVAEGEILVALKTKTLQQNDVIAFYCNNRILVRRVIASGGDVVNIDAFGLVDVNEQPLAQPYRIIEGAGTTDNNNDELFNTNDVTLTYRHWESTDQVGVETYEFDLVKTTSPTYQERLLNGATFKLYGSVSGNDEIGLVLEETIYEIDNNTGLPTETVASRVYRKALPGETPVAAIEAGLATIRGLGNGSYFVEEIEAPEGYNKLQSRESISLSGNNDKATFLANGGYDDGGLQVINRTGAELPSTGGIGTYLFYGVGAILVVGAVVVLVSKKRMHAFGD